MAITTTERTQITQLAVSMFGAAPGGYLTELVDMYNANGKSMTALANALANMDAYKVNFPSYLSNEETAAKVAAQYGMNSADNGIGTEAYNFVLGELNNGKSLGEIYVYANDFMYNTTLSNWAEPHNLFVNQVKISNYYTVDMQGTEKNLDVLKSALAGVTSSSDFSTTAKMDAFISSVSAGMTHNMLTVDQDIMTGTSGNDMFNAYLVDNANTFQSGDIINGGAGTDSLYIELGTSQTYAIAGKTQSIENVYVRNQANAADDWDNGTNASGIGAKEASDIDAQDMVGVKEWWSVDSRADLQIEDVRSDSHLTTIGVRNTDAGDVDYEVYFDHATAFDPTSAGATLYLRILDLQSMQEDGTPLGTNPYNGVSFKVDGVTVTAKADAAFTGTFAEMVAELNASLVSQGYSNLTVALGSTYSAIKADTGVAYTGTELVITNSAAGVLTTGGWTTPDGSLPATNNMYTTQSTTPPSSTDPLTSVDIVLDNVGRGSQSGDVVVGLITDNNSNGTGNNSGEGIQQFNVSVDRNSWIQNLASTDNVLEEVNLVNIAENNTAGNGSVRIDELLDVKTFNASAMEGSVTLAATLTEGVVGKYMDLVDDASNPAADLDSFNYSTGNGNDSVTMTIDGANLAYVGTTTREDFSLNISTGAGDDVVVTDIANTGAGSELTENGYINSKINANLQVNTGEGNDTVRTLGEGDFVINTGSGNDTIYSDNTGAQSVLVNGVVTDKNAVWVLNTATQTQGPGDEVYADLQSSTNASTQLYKASMVVTYKDLVSTVTIASTNYMTSDLQINQAIKDAINNDATLSKLLVAKDGPANTLIVESLIDGANVDGDLAIDIDAHATLTTAEVTAINAAWGGTAYADSAAANTAMNVTADTLVGTYGDAYMPVFAENDTATAEIVGANSTGLGSDNTITAGTGDDVIVLSTTGDDLAVNDLTNLLVDDLYASNETVVYNAAFGNDVIVNFTADADVDDGQFSTGTDVLDFTAFLSSGVATTLNAGVDNNSNITITGLVSNGDSVIDAGENDSAAAIKQEILTDDVAANKGVYIAVDTDKIGHVYSIVDGTAATDLTVTLLGTIDLADTAWTSLTVDNFA